MSDNPAADAAREEATRQAVEIVMLAVALPVLAWIERKSSQPDALRLLRMRAAKAGERAAATVAGRLWRVAELCRLEYERGRS